ncbi:FAD-dependent oxidoreductase [Metaclostridioides mangenotii]|uniref:Flavorubredoxin/NADPH-dependent 2,4-dienoyl-CoA reductase/sulfur reductase-like enzyme n=1 Tax=Metaclostridioides mangenotii TaxID=1540 RepID=A0ABS4E8N1_9FIRM|nr:FAD-dependent oxidoreductase [Clostridioides mangenotii]MBP1854278.1 flavorubredoxin/NADPH-dependent 2,4-dienoyl-CoA reductase/sulfur reductase-like enzyme [Clostridioides mangenotii]
MSLKSLEIKKNLHWVGALDPGLRVFDIIMYTPYGTTYNSYVLKGSEKTVLFETVKDKTFDQYIERLKDLEIDLNTVDYIVISHTEPDHAGSVEKMLDLAPNAKIVASERAVTFLKEIVNRDFEYTTVEDGDTLSLGDKTLEFYSVPMLHWPDTIYTYIKEDKTLVTCDSFGSHYSNEKIVNTLNEEEEKNYLDALRYYYDNIMGPFKPFVVTAVDKIRDLDIDVICPGHGPVLTENPRRIVDLYYKWSSEEQLVLEKEVTICYVSAYGYTKTVADTVKDYIEKNTDYKVNTFDLVDSKLEEVMPKVINSQGIILGTPTILGDALPPIWNILMSLNPVIHGGKVASVFGSYGWSGEGTENLMERLKQLRMVTIEPLAVNFKPSHEEIGYINQYADKFVEKLKHTFSKKKGKKRFKCVICNEIFDGDEPPQVCPACGAKEDQFIEVYEEEILYHKDTNEHYVVVGNGGAGFYAADAIRKRNNTCDITMISDESELTYYRPALSDGLNEVLGKDFFIADKKWYEENNIKVRLETRVDKVNDKDSTLSIGNETLKYDKLIIATGSSNFIPPIAGHDFDNVYTLRNKKHLETIKVATDKAKKVVVIGGGLLGLEAAWEFKLKGLEVVVAEAMDNILCRQLDTEGSAILRSCIEEDAKVTVMTGVAVESIEKANGTTNVVFKDGNKIDCDMVVFSIGVRSNIGIAKDTSLDVERGIVVNRNMKTSVDNIFACGDVAQIENAVLAIWPTAIEMGRIAGANACGDEIEFENESYPVSLDAMEAKVFTLGNIQNYDGELSLKDPKNKIYKKLFMKDDKLVGAILINDMSSTVKVMRLMGQGANTNEVAKEHII